MVRFSQDLDVLKYEPVLFGELARASQVRCAGEDAVLSGTTLTAAGASFATAGVAAGQVVYLSGATVDGAYEVVSVDSATQLTVSVVRAGREDAALAPPAGTGLSYRVSTYDPQAEEVAYGLLQYFGLEATASEAAADAGDILETRALRQASVFGVLAGVFAAAAGGEEEDAAGYWRKSVRYQKLFETARARVRVKLDTDGDDLAEEYRSGGSVRLRRV